MCCVEDKLNLYAKWLRWEKNDLYIPIRNKSAQSIDYRSQLS
uniref:Uncharacterized protein n=1 Tax=Vitis vinifera TaxID=29760 RepID=F6HMJ2_VITVI